MKYQRNLLTSFLNNPVGPGLTSGALLSTGDLLLYYVSQLGNYKSKIIYVIKLEPIDADVLAGSGGNTETPRNDIWQHDCSNVRILSIVYEVCMDGTASQLFAVGMPCLK